jgi:hypothetical protein
VVRLGAVLVILMPSNDHSKNASGWRALLAEVETATAMMRLARISRDYETVRRCRQNARHSYQTAVGLVLGTSMSEIEEDHVWNLLAPVRDWLEEAGVSLRGSHQEGSSEDPTLSRTATATVYRN